MRHRASALGLALLIAMRVSAQQADGPEKETAHRIEQAAKDPSALQTRMQDNAPATGGTSASTANMPSTHDTSMPAMEGMSSMDMQGMQGMLGHHPMTRESSGTAWQPDSSPMVEDMFDAHGWRFMSEGYVTQIYDHQGEPRGNTQTFTNSMGMLMASRDMTATDRIGLRTMLSLDPAMGESGYPLLFATGETANGNTPLIDRQHPHDLFMELAATWSHVLTTGNSLSLYAGLPGEPALGPATFMHRVSGMDNPEAPIGHHWFDSTHITYGVVTAAFSTEHWMIESSVFRGREPDQHRWDIESPRLDSWSVRVSWNPTANLSFQASTGHLHSPEQLQPSQNEQRTTASLTWNKTLGTDRSWATTLGWSDKAERPGPALTGLLAETSLRLGHDEIYARAERVQENELFDHGPLLGQIFDVEKLSIGYQREYRLMAHLFLAIGGVVSAYDYPAAIKSSYGAQGFKSCMLYGRLRFGA